jgi:protein tyrosine/serine phosphatase
MGICRGVGNRNWISDMGLVWFRQISPCPQKIRRGDTGAYLSQRANICSTGKKNLTKYNIRVIIDLSSVNPNNPDKLAEEKAAAELNIKILRFSLNGNGTGDVNYYVGAVTAIANAEKQNLPVLVHCAAGAQRTGGVIAIYRVLVQKIDPNIVEDEIEEYGCPIDDRPALRPFLNDNMADLAIRLKQAGVIDQIPDPMPQIPRD